MQCNDGSRWRACRINLFPVLQLIHPTQLWLTGKRLNFLSLGKGHSSCVSQTQCQCFYGISKCTRDKTDPRAVFSYHGDLWHRQTSRRLADKKDRQSKNPVAFTFAVWAEVSNWNETGGSYSIICLFTFVSIWNRSHFWTRWNFDWSCSCSHCFILDVQIDITNLNTTTTTSCLYFCSWQDTALTNVSRADDNHWWFLRSVDSRSRWVNIPFQGQPSGEHSTTYPY